MKRERYCDALFTCRTHVCQCCSRCQPQSLSGMLLMLYDSGGSPACDMQWDQFKLMLEKKSETLEQSPLALLPMLFVGMAYVVSFPLVSRAC